MSTTHVYKEKYTYQSTIKGRFTEMQHLSRLIHDEKYICWTRNMEESLLLIYPRHILSLWSCWTCFIWCWFLTIHTKQIGMSSHYLRSFSAGFSYLEHEREKHFTWTLKKLRICSRMRNCFIGSWWQIRSLRWWMPWKLCFHPHFICCVCAIFLKNVSMKCKDYVKYNRQKHVMNLWNKVMYSNSESDFEQNLQYFEVVCVDIPSFVEYVHQTWLTPYKEKFVSAWTNRVTHWGTWQQTSTSLWIWFYYVNIYQLIYYFFIIVL